MYICNNCGANVDENNKKCPFCGSIDFKIAENDYMNELYSMNAQMDVIDDEVNKVVFKRVLRRALITFACCVVVLLIGVLIGKASKTSDDKYSDKIRQFYSDYDDTVDNLNKLVEERKFEEINNIYKTKDYSFSSNMRDTWKYGVLVYIHYNKYSTVENYINRKYTISTASSYASIYSYAVDFCACLKINNPDYYQNYMHEYYVKSTGNQRQILDEWLSSIENFVVNDLEIPKDVFESDIEKYVNVDKMDMSELRKRAEGYYKK